MQNLIINITQENFAPLENENFGCFILSPSLSSDFKREFIDKAQKKNRLCLLFGEEYSEFSADGAILDLSKDENPQKIIKEFKQKYPAAVIGVISRNRRHEAMLISECEPEFVIFRIWTDGFEKNKELLEWYNELFLLQSAVWPQDNCAYSTLSADFVIIDDVFVK